MMKKIMMILLLAIFANCQEPINKELDVSEQLWYKIERIVEKYEEHTSKKEYTFANPSVYEVHFTKRDNVCYVIINTNFFYWYKIDAYTKIDGNLIAFYGLKDDCNTLVKSKMKINFEMLSDFDNEDDPHDNYSPAIWTYKIIDNKLVLDNQNRHSLEIN